MRTLHIRIDEHDGSAYRVRARLSGGPEATSDVPCAGVPGAPPTSDADAADLERFGEALHALVCGPALSRIWSSVAGQPVRILLDVRPAGLRDLPWELLFDAAAQKWVFGDPRRPVARAHQLPFVDLGASLRLPIRMLVLVGAPEQADRDELRVDEELDAIVGAVRDAGCLWQVDVLDGASRADVTERMTEFAPHVLHFIGHGTTDEAGRPALEIARRGHEPQPLTAQFVVNALAQVAPPRLVVLNACRTADGTPLSAADVTGLSGAFLGNGAVATVTMRGDIEPRAAVCTSTALYSALAAGQPVDVAVAAVHTALHWADGYRAGDWAMPALTVRADPERVLESSTMAGARATLSNRAAAFPELRWLVDRTVDRYRVLRRLVPDDPSAAPRLGDGLAFLTGVPEVGKTTVVRSCVLVAWQCGLPVVHADLPIESSLDCAGFLRKIARAVPDGLGDGAAGELLDDLDLIFNGNGPVPAGGRRGAGVAGGMAAMPTTAGRTMPGIVDGPVANGRHRPRTRTPQEIAFERFRRFLVEVAGGEPLLLVIDGMGRMDERELAAVRAYLFEPAARGELDQVRLLVAGRSGELDALLSDGRFDASRVRLEPFGKKDVIRLISEFATRRRPAYPGADEARWEQLVDSMQSFSRTLLSDADAKLMPSELLSWELVIANRWEQVWAT